MAGAKRFEDLDAWKLSVDLRDGVIRETTKQGAPRSGSFCDQICDSARSAPSNIAEGFGAYSPREFARYTRIARKSLMETRNHLFEARTHRYFAAEAVSGLLETCERALGATTRLLRYLDSCKGKPPADWRR